VTSLPAALRRAQILERIDRDGGVTVVELARAHGVSQMTAHRDLEQLARDGRVERVRGGARAVATARAGHPTAWSQRVEQAAVAKAAIAKEAAALVHGGATIFLDASSTALALARRLTADPPPELTLVTNSPAIVYELQAPSLHVVVCPGELDQHTRAVQGRWTVEFLRGLNLDLTFMSAAGMTPEAGLTTSRRPLADVINAARAVSARTVALIDASKVGRASLVSIARAQELERVIVDAGVDPAAAEHCRRSGIELHLAGPPAGSARATDASAAS
jgi:DeoR family fructose operon transcriptional repressor